MIHTFHCEKFRERLARNTVILATSVLTIIGSVCHAGDWPQILGPDRNGIAEGETITKKWPATGPPTVWKHSVGQGYSGVAVAGDKAIVFHRLDDREVVEALDAKTGRRLWKNDFPAGYTSRIAPDSGPRCVPVIHKERVFLVGAEGRLHCLNLANGKTLWSRWLKKDFATRDSYFGSGSTPIVADGKLLLNVGGRDGAGIVAFSLADGKTIWKSTDEDSSYSSPVAANINGDEHVIFATRLNAVGVNPADGRQRFAFPFGKRGPTVNGANPVLIGNRVFLSAAYGIGAKLARIDKSGAKVTLESDDLISSQYTTSIHKDGFLYGVDGRQDVGVARLRCLDLKTGKIRWTKEGFGKATLILAGDTLLAMKTDGALVALKASPAAYTEIASARISKKTMRALPALANGLLYVRDTDTLYCVRVGK